MSDEVDEDGEMGGNGSDTRNDATIDRGYVREVIEVGNDEGVGRIDGEHMTEDTGRADERRPVARRVARLPVSSGNVRTFALPNNRTRHMEGGVIGKCMEDMGRILQGEG